MSRSAERRRRLRRSAGAGGRGELPAAPLCRAQQEGGREQAGAGGASGKGAPRGRAQRKKKRKERKRASEPEGRESERARENSVREEFQKGLLTLLEEVPNGFTHMQKGIHKAIEQIKKANAEGSNVNSVIIALTDGTLMDKPFKQTVDEAQKARELGAIIFTVGVHDFDKTQMVEIADSPSHSLAVQKGFSALQSIVDTLAAKTCIEVLSVQPSYVCIKGAYQVTISGRGFSNAKDLRQVICRFTFSDFRIVEESPTDRSDKSISCPGPRIQRAGEEVSLQVSLNNGISFIGNKLIITCTNCGSTRGTAVGSSRDRSSSSSSGSGSSSSDPKPNQLPEEDPDPDPADTTQGKVTTAPNKSPEDLSRLKLAVVFLTAVVVSLMVLCCFCLWRCRKRKKKPPPPEPEKDPEEKQSPPISPPAPPIPPSSPSPVNPSPTVIVACCGCGTRGIQGNLGPCCSCYHPGCHQMPLMWCHPKVQGRCTNFTPSCTHASGNPKLCLPSNGGQECLPAEPSLCSKGCYTLDCSVSLQDDASAPSPCPPICRNPFSSLPLSSIL